MDEVKALADKSKTESALPVAGGFSAGTERPAGAQNSEYPPSITNVSPV